MFRLSLPLACAFALAAPLPRAGATAAAADAAIVGYVFAEAGEPPSADAAQKLTHVNYAFVELRDGKVVDGGETERAQLQALTALRGANPRLRVLASVGGWLGSKGFSDMALTPGRRHAFVESALEFVRAHDLDGLDIDWEYPGQKGNGNPHRPEDRASFSALLGELRAAFDRAGGRPLLLTIAAAASDEYLAHVDVPGVQASVDLVNLMSYDFAVEEAGDKAGHHANLRVHPADPERQSVEGSVRSYLAAGVPASKLVLGVPFYGRGWRGVRRDGLYKRGRPLRRVDLRTYPAIQALIGSDGWTREWDDAAQAPCLWNVRRREFVSYEDPQSLASKCRFVREQGLAGVMFWEYHADPTGELLDALVAGLRR